MATKKYRRVNVKQSFWLEAVCAEGNVHVEIAGRNYFLSADGHRGDAGRSVIRVNAVRAAERVGKERMITAANLARRAGQRKAQERHLGRKHRVVSNG